MLTKANFLPSCQAAMAITDALDEPFKLEARWLVIDVTDGDCDECPLLEEQPDPYNTGDSPSDWECKARSYRECTRVIT